VDGVERDFRLANSDCRSAVPDIVQQQDLGESVAFEDEAQPQKLTARRSGNEVNWHSPRYGQMLTTNKRKESYDGNGKDDMKSSEWENKRDTVSSDDYLSRSFLLYNRSDHFRLQLSHPPYHLLSIFLSSAWSTSANALCVLHAYE